MKPGEITPTDNRCPIFGTTPEEEQEDYTEELMTELNDRMDSQLTQETEGVLNRIFEESNNRMNTLHEQRQCARSIGLVDEA